MPRTKHVRKPKREQQSAQESDLLMIDFERQAQLRVLKMEAESKMAIKSLETIVDVTLSRLPAEIRQMPLGEILNYEKDNDKENSNEISSSVDLQPLASTTVKGKEIEKRITSASDDGYVTEGITTTRTSRAAKVQPTTKRTRSRSNNNNSSKMKLSKINQETVKKVVRKERIKESLKIDKFTTPSTLKPGSNVFDPVTPKIKPNTPLNVLRRPRQGEMVLSMQGSPLLVSAVIQEDIANINVPLRNGNVMSLLPNAGSRMSHIPALDSETVKQLETLKNHIEKVISTK